MSEQETHSDIVKALDSIGAPYGETLGDRIRARGAAYARGSASAMDAIAFARKERDDALAALDKVTTRANAEEYRATLATAEINAVRDALNEALGRVAATVDALESSENRGAEALVEIDALDRALSAAGLPTAETLAGRVAGLQLMRAEALSEARALTTERDNCREVLRKEREDRAAEKATIGNALQTLRAENNALEDIVVGLRKDNAKFLAQLALAERIIVAGLRG